LIGGSLDRTNNQLQQVGEGMGFFRH
jgi:hypothetical protein